MQKINGNRLVDDAKFNRFHLSLVLLLMFLLILDNFDGAVTSVTMPALMQDWGVTPVDFGISASVGAVCAFIGSIVFGFLSDVIGRKPIMIICVLLFTIGTGYVVFMPANFSLYIVRSGITAMGIVGLIPAAIAIISEYAPLKRRNFLISLICIGQSFGAIIASLVGSPLVASGQWRMVYAVALIGFVLIPVVIFLIPESLSILWKKGKIDKVRTAIAKVNREYVPQEGDEIEYKVAGQQKKSPYSILFSEGRRAGSILLFLAYFFTMTIVLLQSGFMPTYLVAAGYDMQVAVLGQTASASGVIIAAVLFGWLADKLSFKTVFMIMYLIGAIGIFCIGLKPEGALLFICLIPVGLCAGGGTVLLNTFTSRYYPPQIVGTAVGLFGGLGRIPGFFVPIVLGLILASNLSHQTDFTIFAFLPLLAMLCMLLIPLQHAYYKQVEATKAKAVANTTDA